MPRGFMQRCSNGKFKVLCLKKTLYGLRQSPHDFWKYLIEKLSNWSLPQAPFDPCLFIVKWLLLSAMLMIWSLGKKEKGNVELAIQLHSDQVDLDQEDDVFSFLLVHIEFNPEFEFFSLIQKKLSNEY